MTDKQLSILKNYADDKENYVVIYDGEFIDGYWETMDKDKVEVFRKIDSWELKL